MDILKGIVPNITKDFANDNDKFNSLLELGETYFRGKEYDKSISAYEKAIEEYPKNSGGWLGKALSHLATTDIIGINEVDVKAYLDSALKYGDQGTLEKYLIGVTLFYSFNYAAAIKLLIDQTNQAIAEKQSAQIQAVVGLATATIGGSIAKNSKGSLGTMIGYGMLAGGSGVTVKKGFDSFKLDQLSKSMYGNALAQTLISVPVIKQCHEILMKASGDLHHNTSVILDSWKESVIYLFKNEKEQFVKDLKKLDDIDNLVNDESRAEVEKKVDEILYFMDMVGLDESNDFRTVMSIKKSISSFKEKFSATERSNISKKKSKLNKGCGIWAVVIFLFAGVLMNTFGEDGGAMVFWALVVWRGFVYYRKNAKINSEAGLDVVEREINQIITEMKEVQIEKNEFDLNLLGT